MAGEKLINKQWWENKKSKKITEKIWEERMTV